MTPKLYTSLSVILKRFTWLLWLWLLLTAVVCVVGINYYQDLITSMSFFYSCMLSFIISWVLILIRYWFVPKRTEDIEKETGIKKKTKSFYLWYSALYVNLHVVLAVILVLLIHHDLTKY